jgi:hypothetical protein
MGFGKPGTGDIANRNQACTVHNGCGRFVRPVFAAIGDLGMDGFDALLLACTLGHRHGVFIGARQVVSGVRFIEVAALELIRRPQINTNLSIPQRYAGVLNLALDVDVPAATGILGETPSFWCPFDGARGPEAISVAERSFPLLHLAEMLCQPRS